MHYCIPSFGVRFSPVKFSAQGHSTSELLRTLLMSGCFGENQLSPGSIGISPLPTPHPLPFQRESVRSSMEFYLHFNLDMGRSPGFGSNITDFIRPIQTRSRCGSGPLVLNLASYINSPDHSTIGTRSPFDGLSVLVSTRFQVLFHSPPGVLFTFPSQYSSLSVTR